MIPTPQHTPKTTDYVRPQLTPPHGAHAVLMHSCCAPCAIEVMEAILASQLSLTVYFYNPNIHPAEEYRLRKAENQRFCASRNVDFIDDDYNTEDWFARVQGLEHEPERGARCTVCFDMRFERTALYAHTHGFPVITSSLGISRWKNLAQINACGVRAAQRYPDVNYWTFNWRKQGGAQRMIALSKTQRFYQQEYCGCVYSLRDTNRWRVANNRSRIRRGIRFYTPNGVREEDTLIASDRA